MTVTSNVPDVPLVPIASGGNGTNDLAPILDRIDALFGRYVAFPSEQARHAVVAWAVHCWVLDLFESTPRLALLSPEKGSGKTRTLEVLELVVPNPLHTVNVSAAALFRKVSEGACTLLLDECDTYLGNKVAQHHEELRGLINAGHRRGAVAYRCVIEKGVSVQEFPAFAPAALAGIGDIPDTILDRSVVIGMKRRAPNEQVAPFRVRRAERDTYELQEWLQDWSARTLDKHGDDELEPDMPDGIVDRAADVWEPLIALGDLAGLVWSERLRTAAVVLNNARQQRDLSLGVQLLSDTRAIFTENNVDRLSTDDLLAKLIARDEAPWSDLRGHELDARGLARRLRPYEVKPGKHRFGDATVRGYLAGDFHDAWARYLTPLGEAEQAEQAEQPRSDSIADLSPEQLFELYGDESEVA